MNSFVAARTLTEYPRGGHRWRLLILTVLASILGAYDFQLAPLLPILLPYLHMSHTAYGAFIAFTVLISGISAFFGGPLAGSVIRADQAGSLLNSSSPSLALSSRPTGASQGSRASARQP